MKIENFEWDERFITLADFISKWSKDPSTKVGAVIVDNRNVIKGVGYNGFPRGIKDSNELLLNKEDKYPRIVHAELNAILNAGNVIGCTLYVCPLPPCPDCAGAIIQSGIKKVVYYCDIHSRSAWIKKAEISYKMFEEVGIVFNICNTK